MREAGNEKPRKAKWWLKWRQQAKPTASEPTSSSSRDAASNTYRPSPEEYPTFPPPPPRAVLQNQTQYWDKITARKYGAPQGVFTDSSLFALYRLYEFILLDKVLDYRNALEAFWRHKEWAVHDIPDPDPEHAEPERYAFLAGCTYLLVRAFNQRVSIGLSRNMRSLMTAEEAEEARNVPHDLRRYEKVPGWAVAAPALVETLVIPTHEGKVLDGKDDGRADPDFLAKNILLWTPHIYFT